MHLHIVLKMRLGLRVCVFVGVSSTWISIWWIPEFLYILLNSWQILLPTIVLLLLVAVRTTEDTQIHPAQPW